MKDIKKEFEKEPVEKKEISKPKETIKFIHPVAQSGEIFLESNGETFSFKIVDGVFEVPKDSPAIPLIEKERFKSK